MRSKVLIVDDLEMNREMLAAILEKEYPILEADSGKNAITMIQEHQDEIAVVLLDLVMPEMDGFAVLEVMKDHSWLKTIPVLVITAESKAGVESKCFEMGVSDFIKKPFDNAIVRNRVKNIVDLFAYKNQLEEKVEKQTATLKKQYKLLVMQAEKLKESNTHIIDILGTVVECRNLESGEHVKRVKGFTRILAEQMMIDYPEYGLTQEKIDVIVSASSLHDIGKIAIPDSILLKPARLTKEEYEYMKSHTTRGCDVLNNVVGVWDEAYSKASYDICRHHHERYDGKGYPDGLAGDAIPISAQLVGLADVYDALVSERVYKSAYSEDEAFHMIVSGECGVFSPKLLECFRKVKKQFEELNQLQNKKQQ
ncbi:MAG: response regulator [Acetatifactor sp.]|nr:response regulator [Acetatifactor sp.]